MPDVETGKTGELAGSGKLASAERTGSPPIPRRLLTDGLSRAITGRLALKPASAAELAAELDVPAEAVRRRIRALYGQGWLVRQGQTRRRGVLEFLYAFDLRSGVIETDHAAEIPTAQLERFTLRTLRLLIREVAEAIDHGSFAARPEYTLTRSLWPLDSARFQQAMNLHVDLLHQAIEIAERGAERCRRSGGETIEATAGIFLFPAPPSCLEPFADDNPSAASSRRSSSRHPVDLLASFTDPLRRRIIDGLTMEPQSAEELARAIAAPVQKVRYELERLQAAGVVVVHSKTVRRGLLAQIYRCDNRRLVIPSSVQAGYDGKNLDLFCRELSTLIFRDTVAGIREGSFELPGWEDHALLRIPMRLDQQAFAEISERMAVATDQNIKLKEECLEDPVSPAIPTYSSLMLFERAPGEMPYL